jgi:hypothetical protein
MVVEAARDSRFLRPKNGLAMTRVDFGAGMENQTPRV